MKKVYILHYWGDNVGPDRAWYPWLKKELGNSPNGARFEVIIPQMPNTDTPIISERVEFLKILADIPDVNTIFVGHSVGCQTILRFLETLPEGARVGKCIFVAGWFNLANLEDQEIINIATPWIETPIDFEKIKKVCSNFKVFLSDNDMYGCVQENKRIYEEKLGANVTVLHNRGHFTEEDEAFAMPEVLNELI